MSSVTPLPPDIAATAREWVARGDAGLSPTQAAELAAWRAADPRHEQAFARSAATWAALGRPRRTGAAAMLLEEITVTALRRKRRRIGAVLTLTLLLASSGVWYAQRPQALPASPSTVVMMVPSRQVLPDGSIVESLAGSEITVDYTGKLRRVTLRKGEAHFKVAPNRERPFVVEAGGIEFRAVGTAFALQLGAQVELLVTEGRVAVDRPSTDRSESAPHETLAYVDAGNRLALDRAAARAPVATALAAPEIDERLAWRNPRVEFSGTPLHEVTGLINRYNRVRLVIDDPGLGDVPLSGLFRADDPETFARLLETGFGLSCERRGDEIILRRAR